MGLLVAILIIALVAAAATIILQGRPGGIRGVGRPAKSPLPRRGRVSARRDPMAAAVADHARATDPQDAMAAEQRLRAQARAVAAGLHAEAGSAPGATAYAAPPAGAGYADRRIDPATGARTDGYGDPANDPRMNDRRYEGRLAADYVPPDERAR